MGGDPELADAGFAEYVTAQSEAPGGGDRSSEAAVETDEGDRLRARVAQLERLLAAREEEAASGTGARRTGAAPAAGRRGARDLFGNSGAEAPLTPADWERLRAVAGQPPGRLAAHERTARPAAALETAQAEIDADVGEDLIPGVEQQGLHQLLAVQTKLLAQLAASSTQRAGDPILDMLAAPAAAKEDGNLGGRGSAARDAFIKLMGDDAVVCNTVRRLLCEELGQPVDAPPDSLLRDYVEKRMPVAEHRLLTMVATLAAHGWQRARETHNTGLEAFCAKLALFADQTALEGGRTQMAWLLTALPEPAYHTLQKRRQQLRPFSRLAASSWMSANVAYVRELDYISTRMSSSSLVEAPKGTKDEAKDEDPDKPDRPPRRQRRVGRKNDKPEAS